MDTRSHPPALTTSAVDRLVPMQAAQQQLGVSRSTLYRLIEEGVAPRPVKLGRRSVFSERELQAWIAARLNSRQAGGAQ